MKFKTLVLSDLFRYSGSKNYKAFLKYFFNSRSFRFIFFYRAVTNYSNKHVFGIIARLWYRNLTTKLGYQVPKSVKIGKGFMLIHFGHLIINSKAVLGDNCNIYQV